MKSAKAYAEMAGRARELELEVRTDDSNPYKIGLRTAESYLRLAASELRKVAEHAAQKEKAES